MEQKIYEQIGESLFRTVLPNGLTIYVCPKKGFRKNFAFFATNYGGMDMKFELDGVLHDTPAGIAHYLEHKMFDTEDGNALQDLATQGASPNAFTSNAITGYYFEGTDHFLENLRILLSFVSIPYFTKESVDKEQGIIGQEIRMIEDNPEWQVYSKLMEALYESHPIRTSVAGSIESISHITAETLYACHKAFYVPANMVLTVAGDVDPEAVAALAEEILPKEGGSPIHRAYGGEEPKTAAKPYTECRMEVASPIFQIGYKLAPVEGGEARLHQELLGELCCEALLGTSTPLYASLYEKGLVNGTFGYGYEDYPGCAFLCVGGESKEPKAVQAAILAEAERIGKEGVDEALWQRLKKAAYGGRVRGLNSFENICVEQAQGHFAGIDYMTFPEAYASVTKEEVEEAIRTWITAECSALSVVWPKEET